MKIFIKVAPRDYSRLRGHIPNQSAAYEAIEKATRLDIPSMACCLRATPFPVTGSKLGLFSK